MPELDSAIASAFYGNFLELRPAQKAAIDPLLLGRNIILTAGTGSGKTEAVTAPIVNRYWREARTNDALAILYIAPTKALVNDIEKRLSFIMEKIYLRVGVRHGDKNDIRKKPHLLITTPESLEVMLIGKETSLFSVRAIIIDEIHQLYNTQRGLQLSILVQRLKKIIKGELQWAALSATVADLPAIRDFLFGKAASAEFFSFPATRTIESQIRHIKNENDFLSLIKRIIENKDSKLLVFANSRKECERLSSVLQRDANLKHYIFTHYSSLSTRERLNVEKQFSLLRKAVCIATSTLELGIDIGDIDVVLLWGMPSGVDSFLQRIGRSNRRSNKTNVICLIPDGNRISLKASHVRKDASIRLNDGQQEDVFIDALHFAYYINSGRKGELIVREPFELFGACAQQFLVLALENEGKFISSSDFQNLVMFKEYVTSVEINDILGGLSENNFLKKHSFKNSYCAGEETYRLRDMKLIYGNFPLSAQEVKCLHGSKHIGNVPIKNVFLLKQGNLVRFSGRTWKILRIGREGFHLEATSSQKEIKDFNYGGLGIRPGPEVMDGIWDLIHGNELPFDIFTKELREKIVKMFEKIQAFCSWNTIPYIKQRDGYLYCTFAGTLVNKAIAFFSNSREFEVTDIGLYSSSEINWAEISTATSAYSCFSHELFEDGQTQTIYQQRLPLALQEREFFQGWLKNQAISKILTRLKRSIPIETQLGNAMLLSVNRIENGLTLFEKMKKLGIIWDSYLPELR